MYLESVIVELIPTGLYWTTPFQLRRQRYDKRLKYSTHNRECTTT